MAPGASWKYRCNVIDISDADLAELNKSTGESSRETFVWGRATYIDIFDDRHTVEFRYRPHARRYTTYESAGEKWMVVEGWELYPEEDGNNAT